MTPRHPDHAALVRELHRLETAMPELRELVEAAKGDDAATLAAAFNLIVAAGFYAGAARAALIAGPTGMLSPAPEGDAGGPRPAA